MSTFLHNLMEGLRGREQFLEDKASSILATQADELRQKEIQSLRAELKDFKERIKKLQESGESYDEHFERSIKDDHRQLEVRIDSWSKSVSPTK